MKLFESPQDRDGTIVIIAVFVLLAGTLVMFRAILTESEVNFVLGALVNQIGNIVLYLFKRKEDNGNGKNS